VDKHSTQWRSQEFLMGGVFLTIKGFGGAS